MSSPSFKSIAETAWDIIVIGAGPAGATAAREIARAGAKVLLVEKTAFPRDKVCGCCLNAVSLAAVERAGLREALLASGAPALERVVLYARGRQASLPLPRSRAVSRSWLDTALADAAVHAGAFFQPETKATLLDTDALQRRVRLEHQGESIVTAAALVIAADGLQSATLRKALGAGTVARKDSHVGIAALTRGFETLCPPGEIRMACGCGGYVGMTRLEDGRLNMAAALDPRAMREAGPAGAILAVLHEAGIHAPVSLHELSWKGTPPLTQRPPRLGAERLIAVGDAAGYIEPFTGEGMAWAMTGGEAIASIALEAADAWRPEHINAWERRYARDIRKQQYVCRATAWLLRRPRLARGAVRLLAADARLAKPLLARLNTEKV